MAAVKAFIFACSALLLLAGFAQGSDLLQDLGQQDSISAPDVCSSIEDQNLCLKQAKCAWCGVGQLPRTCVRKTLLALLPSGSVTCDATTSWLTSWRKGGEHAVKLLSGDSCSNVKLQEACGRNNGCTWCNSKVSWIASECFDKVGARDMDTSMFDCEHSSVPAVLTAVEVARGQEDKVYGRPKPRGAYPPPPPPPPVRCMDVTTRTACNRHRACNWCVLKFTGEGTCYTTTESKYLPPIVFKCSKHHGIMDAVLSRR